MPLSSYIDAIDQKPFARVQYSSGMLANCVSVELDESYDQFAATATLTLASSTSLLPNMGTKVKVYEGYNSLSRQTFTGYVDDIVRGRTDTGEATWVLKCRDVMKLAIETWLDDNGKSYTNTQAETAVADLLDFAGLTQRSLGTTNFTIGDVKPAEFKLMSIMDAINQICTLIGWKCWAGVDGTVYFQYVKPAPSGTSTWSYKVGPSTYNILKYDYTITDRDLRNRIVVMGYNQIRSVAQAASPYVPSPPTYRTAILSSELIDTQAMANVIAAWMLSDLNDLLKSIVMTVVGNPLLTVGKTIRVKDSSRGLDKNFFIFSLRSRNDGKQGGYTMEITAVARNSSAPNYEPGPASTGCCTLPDGSTQMMTEADCLEAGGVYAGDEEPCGEPPPITPGDWRSEVYLLTDIGVYHTTDFSGPAGPMPHWTKVDGGLPASLVYKAIEPDAWRPGIRQYLLIHNNTTAVDELYARTGGDWSLVVDSYTHSGALVDAVNNTWGPTWFLPGRVGVWDYGVFWSIQADINQDGYLALWTSYNVDDSGLEYTKVKLVYFWSTDYGATWHVQSLPGTMISSQAAPSVHFGEVGDLAGSSIQAAGQVVYSPVVKGGIGGAYGLYVSLDKGNTWTQIDSTLDFAHIGFTNDAGNQDIIYAWHFTGDPIAPNTLQRSTDQGTTWSGDLLGGAVATLSELSEPSIDFRYRFHPLLADASGAQTLRLVLDNNNIYKSVDGGVTWTLYAADATLPAHTNLGISLVDDADAKLYGLNGGAPIGNEYTHRAIFASEDEGQTWVDKSGSNASDPAGPWTDSIPWNARALAIIQIWM